MHKNYLAYLLLLTLLTTAFFYCVPSVDTTVSQWFFHHGSFWGIECFPANLLRKSVYFLMYGISGYVLLQILLNQTSKGPSSALSNKACFFVLSCFLIGPVLMTNMVLKNQWGRPRPHEIKTFGGSKHYQPVFVISKQCRRNCSFVCGDTAGAVSLLSLAFIIRRRSKWLTTVILCLSGLVGLIRIAQGGHFLSDVLLSYELNLLCLCVIHRLYYPSSQPDETSFAHVFSAS
jgi:lipid A 4'-phosphatase